MTHCAKVLALLSDGQPHTHHELYALNVIAHSRVADLRKLGHVIACWTANDNGKRVSVYQLLQDRDFPLPLAEPTGTSSSLDELVGSLSGFGSQSDPGRTSRADGNASGNGGRFPDPLISSEQLSLEAA